MRRHHLGDDNESEDVIICMAKAFARTRTPAGCRETACCRAEINGMKTPSFSSLSRISLSRSP